MMRRLATTVTALILAMGLGAGSAAADVKRGELDAHPLEVKPGGAVDVSGRGCSPTGQIDLELFNSTFKSEGSLVSGSVGEFIATIHVPSDARRGRAWIRATCPAPDGNTLELERIILITRPPLAITWVNVAFGLGTTLFVAGIGLEARRWPRGSSRRPKGKGRSGRRRRRSRKMMKAAPRRS